MAVSLAAIVLDRDPPPDRVMAAMAATADGATGVAQAPEPFIPLDLLVVYPTIARPQDNSDRSVQGVWLVSAALSAHSPNKEAKAARHLGWTIREP